MMHFMMLSLLCALVLLWMPNNSLAAATGWHSTRVLIPSHRQTFGAEEKESPYTSDMERPIFNASVSTFWLGAYSVSVARFAAFVAASGHVSTAEVEGGSFLPCMALPLGSQLRQGSACDTSGEASTRGAGVVAAAPWWVNVPGASWFAPEGPGSTLVADVHTEQRLAAHDCIHAQGVRNTSACAPLLSSAGVHIAGRAHQPVVHVSGLDAAAFCEWDGGRLPSEEEWEAAARGGVSRQPYPWGHEWPGQPRRANTWQGAFPLSRSGPPADGFMFVAPISAYSPQNDWGLFNMAGNVWEWTRTAWGARPGGAWGGHASNAQVVKKGGSFLCHRRRCFRYRNAARSYNSLDTSAYNVGFRCAYAQGHGEDKE